MHDNARCLVEHQEILVFKQNIERDGLGLRFSWPRFGPECGDLFTQTRTLGRSHRPTINLDVAFLDQALDGSARNSRVDSAEKLVKPLTRERFLDGEGFRTFGHRAQQISSGFPWKVPPRTHPATIV